jgi:nicotinate-nucleotide adenylyltransferase
MKFSKVVLFGINADPPHEGHLKVALEVQKTLGEGTLIVVMPTGLHPHGKEQKASFMDRLNLTKLLFQGYNHIIVDDFEGALNEKAYTLDTLKYLLAKYQMKSFYFVMSTDVANHFFSWHKPDEVLSLAIPIVVGRKGYNLDSDVLEKLQKCSKPIFINKDIPDVSSTSLRKLIQEGKQVAYLPKPCFDYIQKQHLYR